MKVKVCGLRRIEDVEACRAAGVDAVGFNFYEKSKRYVTPEIAASLSRAARGMTRVGVFVGASPEQVQELAARCELDFIQLHGGEDPRAYVGFGRKVLQVVRVKDAASVPQAPSPYATWVLLDAFAEGFGGAGQRFDWSVAEAAVRRWRSPTLLAGGLTAENVGEAVARVRPFGVDVASGVESAPGVKDAAMIRDFVAVVRAAAGGGETR